MSGGGGGEGGGLIEIGELIYLAKMMVSVLYNELECKVEKLKYKKLMSCSQGSRTNTNFHHVNKPS